MRYIKWVCLLFIFNITLVFSQEKAQDSIFMKLDPLYREDQFYFAITYNQLLKAPKGLSQNGLSTGFSAGFLRDMPINKSRTFGFASGIGLSFFKYQQNLFVSKSGNNYNYEILLNTDFEKNKLEQLFVEIPLEIRWRTSTPESHKFLRIYSGVKLSYLVFSKSKFVGATTVTVFQDPNFNKFQVGTYLSLGWNTWNLHAYYALNPVFKSANIGSEPIDMRALNLGFIFYIL